MSVKRFKERLYYTEEEKDTPVFSSQDNATNGQDGVKIITSPNYYIMTDTSTHTVSNGATVTFDLGETCGGIQYLNYNPICVSKAYPATILNNLQVSEDGSTWITLKSSFGSRNVNCQLDIDMPNMYRYLRFTTTCDDYRYGYGGVNSFKLHYLRRTYTSTPQTLYVDKYKNIGTITSAQSNSFCLTELPNNIKLELVNNTITVKAGSKFYIPAGKNSDGSNKFDIITESIEHTGLNTQAATSRFLFLASNGNYWNLNPNKCYSGNTAPTTINRYDVWYDTANNIIHVAEEAGAWSNYTLSLPFALCTGTVNGFSSIDQIFNGFGYMGSLTFSLPGIKGYAPNGKDNQAKNKYILINSERINLNEYTYQPSNQQVLLTNQGYQWRSAKIIIQPTPPTPTLYTFWLDTSTNLLYYINDDVSVGWELASQKWNNYFIPLAYNINTDSSYKITSLTPYTVQPKIIAQKFKSVYKGSQKLFGETLTSGLYFESDTAGSYKVNLINGQYEVTVVAGGGDGYNVFVGEGQYTHAATGGSGSAFVGEFQVTAGSYNIVVGGPHENSSVLGITAYAGSTAVYNNGGAAGGIVPTLSLLTGVTLLATTLNSAGNKGVYGRGGDGGDPAWIVGRTASVYQPDLTRNETVSGYTFQNTNYGYGAGNGCYSQEYRRTQLPALGGYVKIRKLD